MKLSIIIPAYNAQRYLEETLRSILYQTGTDYEVLVVDDGSTDDTPQIAAAYQHRHPNIRLIRTENRGVSHARNVGLAAATGSYVAFLDADDVLCRDAYTPETEQLLAREAYDLISFGYIQSDQVLHFGRMFPEVDDILKCDDPDFIHCASRKHFSSYLYRRSMLRRLQFFEGIRYGEDTVFLYRVANHAQTMRRLPNWWFVYRNNIHSAMHNSHGWRYLLTDHVPAWHRAAALSEDSAMQWNCYGMVYSNMGEYLRLSAMDGVPMKQLQEDIRRSQPFLDVLSRPGTYWTRQETVALLNGFSDRPRQTWLGLRLRGILPGMARKLSRCAPVRWFYLRLKFRQRISLYLPCPKPAAR